MATPDVLQVQDGLLLQSPFDSRTGENAKSRGLSIEKKIDLLESLTGPVSNRRSRRWINDRLLMELVPRLNAEEDRGLFAPPRWVPIYLRFSKQEWDKFRTIDMDKEANFIDALKSSLRRRKGKVDADKKAVLNAWRRVDCLTREALRRSFLSELLESYEFYNLDSVTEPKEGYSMKITKITRKKSASAEIPNITLSHSLRMSKEGIW